MGVYINMKMPKNCAKCFAGFCKQIGCEHYIGFDDYDRARHPDCPLIEVPEPHGRLIDADKLAYSFEPSDFWNPDAEDNCFAAVRIVHSASTVIPASKEG